MQDFYKYMIDKGGLFGILAVTIIYILTFFIKRLKYDTSNSKHGITQIFRLLRLFLWLTVPVFFILALVKMSNGFKNWSIMPNPIVQDTSKRIGENSPPYNFDSTVSSITNNIAISKSIHFSFDTSGIFMVTQNNYSWMNELLSTDTIAVTRLQNIIKFTIYSYNEEIFIYYKNGAPPDKFEYSDFFSKTSFYTYVDYGLRRYNHGVFIENRYMKNSVFIRILTIIFVFLFIIIFSNLNERNNIFGIIGVILAVLMIIAAIILTRLYGEGA